MTPTRTSVAALLAVLAAMVVLPASVAAQLPAPGIYQSMDLGGQMFAGRYSDFWDGGRENVGNTFNVSSWDGGTLGLQWRVECVPVTAIPFVSDNVDEFGNGTRTFFYSGVAGTIYLSQLGPWGGGSDFQIPVLHWQALVDVTYQDGQEVAATNALTIYGTIYDPVQVDDLSFTLSGSAVELANTDGGGSLPADYPPFTDSSCNTPTPEGAWGTFSPLTLVIEYVTPVEETTWGAVKALFTQ